jgi:hypothetical protein
MYCIPFIIAADWFGFFTSRFNVKFRGTDVALPDNMDVILGIEVIDSPLDRFIPETVRPDMDL